ncbi:MAG: hypothetical protein M3O86_06255 [Actinomycetota bacterium]|nr:hypothetical protein [Actinomycetota bacterium]
MIDAGDADRLVVVQLVDLPVQRHLRMRHHLTDMLRELTLIDLGERSEGDSDVPARLLRFVADVRLRFADANVLFQRQLREAVSEGRQTVTLELALPPSAGQWARAFADYFDEADEFCRSGELLTMASPPDVVAHRHWLADEVERQLAAVTSPSAASS